MESHPPGARSDGELIARAASGDEPAFAELVQRHAELAFRAAWLVLRDADRAHDATQEAFINIHRSLPRFRTAEPFRPWLLAIVGNRARNLIRADRRRFAAWQRVVADHGPQGPTAPSAERVVADADRRRRVLAAVEDLPETDRVIIQCRYFADLGEAETAALLGIARGTVKSRLSRARKRLRARLEGEGLTDA